MKEECDTGTGIFDVVRLVVTVVILYSLVAKINDDVNFEIIYRCGFNRRS